MKRRGPSALAAALLAAVIAACGGSQASAEPPSGPLGPCGADRADATSIGGFPELESLLPREFDVRPPDLANSGRSCSDKALGSLKAHGITELRYAGVTWNQGPSDATVIAVLATPPDQPMLEQAWVEEFYTAGAVKATKTDNVTTTRPVMDNAGQVFRIEALNDLSLQTVVTWNDHGLVHVVIVVSEVGPGASLDVHNERVEAAVAVAAAPLPERVP